MSATSPTLKDLIDSGLGQLKTRISKITENAVTQNKSINDNLDASLKKVSGKIKQIKIDIRDLQGVIATAKQIPDDLTKLLGNLPENLGTVDVSKINTAIKTLTDDVEALEDELRVLTLPDVPSSAPPGFDGGYIVPQLRSRSKRVQFRSHRPRHKKHTKKKGKRHKKKKPRRTRRT